MEGSNFRDLIDDELVMEIGKVAGIGLASGSVWGALVSMLYDGPEVGSNAKYPELIRTGKVCGNYAATFALVGATYVGIEKSLEKYRMKKDYINGAVAGFATGTAVMSFRVRRMPTAILSGSVLALTSVLLDVTGMKTTEDGKNEHHH